jgi:hypothetical protein
VREKREENQRGNREKSTAMEKDFGGKMLHLLLISSKPCCLRKLAEPIFELELQLQAARAQGKHGTGAPCHYVTDNLSSKYLAHLQFQAMHFNWNHQHDWQRFDQDSRQRPGQALLFLTPSGPLQVQAVDVATLCVCKRMREEICMINILSSHQQETYRLRPLLDIVGIDKFRNLCVQS